MNRNGTSPGRIGRKRKKEVLYVENCPVCEGESSPLGSLGFISYYRCRDCGTTFIGQEEFIWDDDTTNKVAGFLGLKKKEVN